MVYGKEVALKEALKLNLQENHLYHDLIAELYKESESQKAKEHLQKVLELAKNEANKQVIIRKMSVNLNYNN